MTEIWYRYEDYLAGQGYTAENGDWIATGSKIKVRLVELPLLKRTPRGVVVDQGFNCRRFIADSWHKKYACPTKELALQSFVARKDRQASIHERRARDARRAIKLARFMGEHGRAPRTLAEEFGG